MDPSTLPPVNLEQVLLAAIPALFAALFATASAVLASVPDARKIALKNTLTGASQAALGRYLENPATVESRWLVLRILALATCAILIDRAMPLELGSFRHPVALLGVLFIYGTPSYLGLVLARRLGDVALPTMLQLLRPFELVIAPLAAPLGWLGGLVSGGVRTTRPPSPTLAESEVEVLVNAGEENGSLGHERAEMLRNVLEFGELKAGDVMVPRTQVTAIDVLTPAEDLLRLVAERAHSRYPVYRERIDNIVGVLHVKDLVAYASTADLRTVRLSDVIRTPVVFVPETQSASSLLMDMRSGPQHHMAIVIDEFGGMSGLVTLEDVVEQIVGDIRDEHDSEEPPIVDLGDGRLMVDAGVPIGDLSRYLGVELPEDGDYNSLGGFIIERVGQVPPVGETISDYGLDFVVREADDRRVAKVEIIRHSQTPGPGSPESLPPQSPRRTAA